MHDVIVIGAGPAGLAAAAYCLRHHLKTLVIAPDLGGKAIYRLRLPWMREREVLDGEDTVEQLRRHLLAAREPARFFDSVQDIFLRGNTFHVHTVEGGAFPAHAVIVATGVRPRELGVPGERRLNGYGLSYSAMSHAPLFAGLRVVVVGSNLRALRAVAELRALADQVTLIALDQADLGSHTLGRALIEDARVVVRAGWAVREILGEEYVSGVTATGPGGEVERIPADGVFVELGLTAHTEFLGSLVERAASGQIAVDESGATGCPGLFAAGDIACTPYSEQILIALGEGARVGISAATYVLEGLAIQRGG